MSEELAKKVLSADTGSEDKNEQINVPVKKRRKKNKPGSVADEHESELEKVLRLVMHAKKLIKKKEMTC